MQSAILHIGDWQLDPHANLIFDEKNAVQLEHKQVQLLLYLVANAGNTVSKKTLLQEIWAGRVVVEDVVAVAISKLRKAMNDRPRAPQYIKTIPGAGYQFIFPAPLQLRQLAHQYYNGKFHDPDVEQEKPLNQDDDREDENDVGDVNKRKLNVRRESWLWQTLVNPKTLLYATVVSLCILVGWINQDKMFVYANLTAGSKHSEVEKVKLFSEDVSRKYQQAWKLRHSFARANTEKAISLLQEIIRQEPDFADAYVLLAMCKRDLLHHHPLVEFNASEELKALLKKAISINPKSSFAHETLGTLLFFVDWNHTQARYHLKKAVEFDPENANAHHAYGLFLLAQAEFDQSYFHIQMARKLNPLHYSVATVAWIYAMQDRHEEAWKETEKLLILQPNELQYHRSAQRLFENAGNQEKAYFHLRKILQLADYNSEQLAQLDEIFTDKKLPGVYRWLAYDHPEPRDIGFYAPPLSYARFAISAGEYDDAFTWLNQALEQHQGLLVWLAVDPKYKPIKNDPRYIRLLDKLGLVSADAGVATTISLIE